MSCMTPQGLDTSRHQTSSEPRRSHFLCSAFIAESLWSNMFKVWHQVQRKYKWQRIAVFILKKWIFRRLLSYPHLLSVHQSLKILLLISFLQLWWLTELYFIYFIFNEHSEKHVSYSSVSFLDALFFYINIGMMKGKMWMKVNWKPKGC